MFTKLKQLDVQRGNFFMFFTDKNRFKKYILAILIGLPTWYVIGVLVAFSNDFGKAFGFSEEVLPKKSTMFAYVAIAVADVVVGLISHWLGSRKKVLFLFYGLTMLSIGFYFTQQNGTAEGMYLICAAMGFSVGFWAIFVTMAAEQFGTNLRATAATTVPNMVRGALPLMFLLFKTLQSVTGNYITAGWLTGLVVMVISFTAAWFTEETFGKDLNYVEK